METNKKCLICKNNVEEGNDGELCSYCWVGAKHGGTGVDLSELFIILFFFFIVGIAVVGHFIERVLL